jgi:pSer/pThr/pTyr-binding forkhead associated (FHA) protein
MPKVTLEFEGRVLKEFGVGTALTIGRLPDNAIVIDNPAVSGHHARILRIGDQSILDDLRSRNGTFVNDQLVGRHTLRHGDAVSIGKHTLRFDAEASIESHESDSNLPRLDDTVYLDTHRHRELLATLRQSWPKPAPRPLTGVLRVVTGRAERPEYELAARSSLIGKSNAALVRLRGWFTPEVALVITRNGDGYDATAVGGKARLNGRRLAGRHALSPGDRLKIGGLTLEFGFKGDVAEPTPGAHEARRRADVRMMSAGERAATARALT